MTARGNGHRRSVGSGRARPAAWLTWTIWGVVALQVSLIALGVLFEVLARESTSAPTLGFAVEQARKAADGGDDG